MPREIFFVASVVFMVCGGPTASPILPDQLYETPPLRNRPLIVKAYPAVGNYQSNLYEVYMEPYTYELRIKSAVAILMGEGENQIKGDIIFTQAHPPVGPVLIEGNVTGLQPGKHGLHVHQSGDTRHGCQKLGEHFNPFYFKHGAPTDPSRHVGDLGNIEVDDDGFAEIHITDALLSLSGGHRGVVGRSIVVTENEDDLGRGGTAESFITGASGKPIACGVVAYII